MRQEYDNLAKRVQEEFQKYKDFEFCVLPNEECESIKSPDDLDEYDLPRVYIELEYGKPFEAIVLGWNSTNIYIYSIDRYESIVEVESIHNVLDLRDRIAILEFIKSKIK